MLSVSSREGTSSAVLALLQARYHALKKAKMLANPEFREAVLAKRREWAATTQRKKDIDPAFRRRVLDRI